MTQTTSSPKSFNYLALRGAGVDDMEYVEQFGLDPSVAYTNKINEVMLDMNERDNTDFYVSEGMDEKEAAAKARDNRMKAERDIKELLAKNGMLK